MGVETIRKGCVRGLRVLGYACYEIDTLYLALVPDSLVAQLVRAPH